MSSEPCRKFLFTTNKVEWHYNKLSEFEHLYVKVSCNAFWFDKFTIYEETSLLLLDYFCFLPKENEAEYVCGV